LPTERGRIGVVLAGQQYNSPGLVAFV
jgi:hypothetical protein